MMKKIRPVMMALLIAVLALSLTACGSKDSRQPTASQGTSGTSAPYSTSRSETDTEGEGVMDGIANDVRDGMEDIKEDVTDMTESDTSAETQNR